ncbi:MAG: topoisomerase [Cellvibrio sp.]|nr:topoisomerase [Cellvibrio sp.]
MSKINPIHKKHSLVMAIACCLAAPLAQAGDFNFSGFLSVGGGMVDDENGPAYGGYDEEDFMIDNNLLGVQISSNVSDKVTATVQLTARSENDYEVDAEWAYLSWQATENSKIRAGRLRTPFYMYSDFLDVGYAYAWISPPQEVYYLPFNNVNGVDFYTANTLGIFDTTFQAYFGGFDDELDLNNDGFAEEAKTRNQMGVAGTLGKDWWTLRAAYHKADLWVDVTGVSLGANTIGDFAGILTSLGFGANANNLLVEEDSVTFAEVGLNIDTGRFVAAAEYVEFEADDALFSKNKRGYVMGGVRFGEWLVHLTASQSKDEASHPEAGIPVAPQTAPLIGALQAVAASQAIERDVITVGTRWDVTSGTALKFQIDDVDDENQGDQKVFSVALQTVF